MTARVSTVGIVIGALGLAVSVVSGQAPAATGVQRTVVQRGDVSVAGREALTVRIEIAPGASTGRHTHPGDEIDYVLEGQLELTFDGQPPRVVKPGESAIIPGGTIHTARNPETTPLKAVGVFVVEKGKPLTTPVQ